MRVVGGHPREERSADPIVDPVKVKADGHGYPDEQPLEPNVRGQSAPRGGGP